MQTSLTLNPLQLGRNNERSPVGGLKGTNDPNKFIASSNRTFIAWLEAWLIFYVLQRMEYPKRFNSEALKVGDIVLFLKNKKELCNYFQIDIIVNVEISKYDKIREVKVKCRNHNENTDRLRNE